MINDPRFSIEDIGQVICKDPALTARLLKVVNSSLYGFQSKIDTVSRAIAVIGIDDLRNLVLATSVIDTFSDIPPHWVDMTAFWMHSVHCGLVAKLLARRSGVLHCERLFILGLLHNIGSLVMYHKMPEAALKVLVAVEHKRYLIPDFERTTFGFTHAEVGGELIKRWHLPESLYEAIGCYLNPESSIAHRLDTCLLAMAVVLVDTVDLELTLADLSEEMLSIARLDLATIREIAMQANQDFSHVFHVLAPTKMFH